ncbi:MAG: hypothetical protein MJZ22_02945 [Candidatus Saccharibacteria bacterium]|nr:hypothetical protein [Candidatus Saccharibacteria bacterium]
MIRSCKNCAGMLKYDVVRGGLYCNNCGSVFGVDEFDNDSVTEEELIENEDIECSIFQCSACGAEISVTNTEASTYCIYCGNPTIVFSRIGKMKRPECIVPFKIDKETALAKVKETMSRGFFVPKEIRNFEPELLRGIYIPYYVTNIEYDASMLVSTKHRSGKNTVTRYHKRSGYASMPWITTDASTTLADDSSQRVEPYNLREAVPFSEDYLIGFYSDISDVESKNAERLAQVRAKEVFTEELMKDIKGSDKKIVSHRYRAVVVDKPITAMLPAWFLTFKYKDKPYTIIVNGQTGKAVGGVPWKKALFTVLLILMAAVISIAAIFVLSGIFEVMFSGSSSRRSSNSDSESKFIVFIVSIAIAAIVGGIKKIKKVLASINRTTASTLTTYVNKRQKGE